MTTSANDTDGVANTIWFDTQERRALARLDEELTPSADATSVVWRLGGEVLCRVERVGDLLQASIAPRHEPSPTISSIGSASTTKPCSSAVMRALMLKVRRPAASTGPERRRPLRSTSPTSPRSSNAPA